MHQPAPTISGCARRQAKVVVSERGVRGVITALVDAFSLCSSGFEGPFSPFDEAPRPMRGGVRADNVISLGEVRRVEKSTNPADTLSTGQCPVSVLDRNVSAQQRMLTGYRPVIP